MKKVINFINLAFLLITNASIGNEFVNKFSPSNAEEKAEYQKFTEASKNFPEKVMLSFQSLSTHYVFIYTLHSWFIPVSGDFAYEKPFMIGEIIQNGPDEEQVFIKFKKQFINEINKNKYSDNDIKAMIHAVRIQLDSIDWWIVVYKELYFRCYNDFMNEFPSFSQPLKDKVFKGTLYLMNFPIIN